MDIDTIVCGDCLDVMRDMPDDSIDLIAVDPPYYKVKGDWWDRQWNTPAGFLDWIGQLCAAWHRILRPNGSLYVFASPEMSDRVSVKVREWFNVLTNIVWDKKADYKPGDQRATAYRAIDQTRLRSYFDHSERIIFAEHYGSDGYAKGDIGDHFFQPLQRTLLQARNGASNKQLADKSGLPVSQVSHYFRRDANGWRLPTQEIIDAMGLDLDAQVLRREYEDLRREYEDLRRPFNATPDAPYTDVWTFETVSPYPGKHPCEKPLDLMEHIVTMSSKPDGMVFDCCCGNGTTAVAALKLGRHFYGCDINEDYVRLANERIEKTRLEMSQMELELWEHSEKTQ